MSLSQPAGNGERKLLRKERVEVSTGSGLPYERKELAVLCHQREVISKAGLMEPAGKPRGGGQQLELEQDENYTDFRR